MNSRTLPASLLLVLLAACGDQGGGVGGSAAPGAGDAPVRPGGVAGTEEPIGQDRRRVDTRGRLDVSRLPPNVLVEHDGQPLAGVVLFDPGEIRVYLHVDGAQIESRAVTIRAGETATIDLDSLLEAARKRQKHLRVHPGCGSVGSVDLEWFAAHRSPNGTWDAARFVVRCTHDPRCDGAVAGVSTVESTALVLLAFLAEGDTHERGHYRAAVRAGVDRLVAGQSPDGLLAFGARDETRVHAIATCALVELVGATGSPRYARPAQAAVDHLLDRRRPLGGWSRRRTPEALDVPATAWAVLALDAARRAGLTLPEGATERLADDVAAAGAPDAQGRDLADAALITLAALVAGRPTDDPAVVAGTARLLTAPPSRAADPALTWAATAVVFRVGGPNWQRWNAALRDVVVARDVDPGSEGTVAAPASDADAGGTWPIGRLRGAAYVQLTRGIYYRYGRALGVSTD